MNIIALLIAILLFFPGATMLQADAPQSLVGFRMHAKFTSHDPFSPDTQLVIDFGMNGTYSVRVYIAQRKLRPFDDADVYLAPFGGTYEYQPTSKTTGVLIMDSTVFPGCSYVLFSNDSEGIITRSSDALPSDGMVQFSLSSGSVNTSGRALVNLSVLVTAKKGETTTLGFAIGGSAIREIMVRAVGPSLKKFGVVGYSVSPTFSLHPSPRTLGSSPQWDTNPATESTLLSEGYRAGAFPLDPHSRDRAEIFLLSAGCYTITVTPSSDEQAGAQLIEVYEIP